MAVRNEKTGVSQKQGMRQPNSPIMALLSIVYLTYIYRISIVYLSCIYRISIVYLSYIYRVSIVYLTYIYRVSIVFNLRIVRVKELMNEGMKELKNEGVRGVFGDNTIKMQKYLHIPQKNTTFAADWARHAAGNPEWQRGRNERQINT